MVNSPVRSSRALLLLFGSLVACTAVPEVDLNAVYDRTDRDFDSAILFRPDDAAEGNPEWTLAPLLIVQNGKVGDSPPVVSYERTEDGWTYRWWSADGSNPQGIHATLGADRFPIAYEALTDSSGARLLFVDISAEEAATDAYGSPLPERRFSIERAREHVPAVAVGGLFEPGPMPLGPFVYLWEQTHDVNIVLCRCMPSRVIDIVDSVAYTLIPFDPRASPPELTTPAPLTTALRLPVD